MLNLQGGRALELDGLLLTGENCHLQADGIEEVNTSFKWDQQVGQINPFDLSFQGSWHTEVP